MSRHLVQLNTWPTPTITYVYVCLQAGKCDTVGEADAMESTKCDDVLWSCGRRSLAGDSGRETKRVFQRFKSFPLPPAETPKLHCWCRKKLPSQRHTLQNHLHGSFEAQNSSWNTSAMSLFSSCQQTLSCTCQAYCTLANPTRLRRQHHTCVLQSLQRPASISESQSTGSHCYKSARKLACRALWHAAQHRRRQMSSSNATRFEDGEAESTGVTTNFDDDELTALDGETSGHAWTATAAPPGMPRPSTSTSCKGCPASF